MYRGAPYPALPVINNVSKVSISALPLDTLPYKKTNNAKMDEGSKSLRTGNTIECDLNTPNISLCMYNSEDEFLQNSIVFLKRKPALT